MSGEWKTAAEWATLNLDDFPESTRGVNMIAAREHWRDLGTTKARKREAIGGGWEYHISCLPEAAQQEYANRLAAQAADTQLAERAASDVAVVERSATDLSARHRRVMEARAAVLREVDRRVFTGRISRRKAILSLVDDVAWDLDCVKQGREDQCVLTPALLKAACDANDRGAGLSLRAVFYWIKAYETDGAVALAPAVTRQKQPVPDWLSGFLRHYCNPAKPSIAHALEKYHQSLPEDAVRPSYPQVKRALKSLQGTARFLDAHRGREGQLALKARLGFVTRTMDGLDPTMIYTADGKTFDALVEHPVHHRPFRPEITTVMDVVTRKVVGWSVGLAENTFVVAEALRRACEDPGIPAIFYTDRGPGYKNKQMDHDTLGLCARLGITTAHSLPYNSQARGLIERLNGTLWSDLAKDFPTYLNKDMDREARQLINKKITKEIKEFGASPTLPTWEAFRAAAEAAIAAYNDTVHDSLRVFNPVTKRYRKASPNDVWADFEKRGFELIRLEEQEADDLFRPFERRKVARGQVSFNTNEYFDQRLEPYHDMEVLVGYDMFDASKIWVRKLELQDGAPVAGSLICVADFFNNKHAYMPKSMQQSAVERRAKGRIKRIDEHRQEAIEEAMPPVLIGHQPGWSMPELTERRDPAPVSQHPQPAPAPARKLHADVELAMECLADPGQLTPGRTRLLREFYGRPAGRELLRLSGVDLDELYDLLRSAA